MPSTSDDTPCPSPPSYSGSDRSPDTGSCRARKAVSGRPVGRRIVEDTDKLRRTTAAMRVRQSFRGSEAFGLCWAFGSTRCGQIVFNSPDRVRASTLLVWELSIGNDLFYVIVF